MWVRLFCIYYWRFVSSTGFPSIR